MSYQLYRNTTLGNTLQESLDELIQVSRALFVAHFCVNNVIGYFVYTLIACTALKQSMSYTR